MAKSMRIRTDDQVVVISGKDAGKTGRVVRTDPKKRARLRRGPEHGQAPRTAALGQGRPRSGGEVGGIIEKEGPIHVSNVMLLDPKDNKPTRVGVRRDEGGKRERFAKRTGTAID